MLTLLFAKVFGLYMIIAGAILLTRRRFILSAIAAFVEDKPVRLVIGVLDILLGLFVLNLHSSWATLPACIITAGAWLALIKGVVTLVLSDATLEHFIKVYRDKKFYVVEGIIIVLIGIYLAGYGYDLF